MSVSGLIQHKMCASHHLLQIESLLSPESHCANSCTFLASKLQHWVCSHMVNIHKRSLMPAAWCSIPCKACS